MTVPSAPLRGRGTPLQPANRFEPLHFQRSAEDQPPDPRTQVFRDAARSILTTNTSPDIPFSRSLNPYRGCEHGCIYCYARPTHEFYGLSAGLDFETRIFAKRNAPELLRRELCRPSWEPEVIALSGITDPYQPIERSLRITRGCLEVLAKARHPVGLITKSALVTRDLDVLQELARHRCVSVTLSLTTLDPELARRFEPRAAQPAARLRAVRALADAGVPVGVNLAPIVPGLNDHEIPALLEAAADSGAGHASYLLVRLPHGVKELFADWLDAHYPERRAKVLNRIRGVRGGRLNDPRFGSRMRGTGLFAEQIRQVFLLSRKRAGLAASGPELAADRFRRPGQLALF